MKPTIPSVFALLLLCAGAPSAAPADPFASDWVKSLKSEARLVAGEQTSAGAQIRLAPHTITYWRDPGDAGVPPTFDFSGSTNLRSADVVFPAPRRIVESDGSVAYGYDSDVLFPIRVTPLDAKKPTALKLALNYAACEAICLPARAALSVVIAPGVSSPYGQLIDAANARAPVPVDSGLVKLTPAAGSQPFRVCLAKPLGANPTLFLEGPEGWRASATPAPGATGESCFLVKVMEKPAANQASNAVRLTFVGDAGAFETTSNL